MEHHEREFCISKIRTGNFYYQEKLIIKPISLEKSVLANIAYNNAYKEAQEDDVMTEAEMLRWMKENGFWHKVNENNIEKYKNNIEDIKVEMYEKRMFKKQVKDIRYRLRVEERKVAVEYETKNSFYEHTCESVAQLEKIYWIVKNSTYDLEGNRQNIDDEVINDIVSSWGSFLLQEYEIRELARNEPWKSLWSILGKTAELFSNEKNTELNQNQKSLAIWSRIYDSVHESIDSPEDYVIEDDDILDGWFIFQSRKRKAEKKQNSISSRTSKNSNAQELFLMADSLEDAQDIYSANDTEAKNIISQRSKQIQSSDKPIEHYDLADKQIELRQEYHKMVSNQRKK